eukprot:COSAG02_NODE_4283_length_5550_cov_3.230050_2_plen_87_part_00
MDGSLQCLRVLQSSSKSDWSDVGEAESTTCRVRRTVTTHAATDCGCYGVRTAGASVAKRDRARDVYRVARVLNLGTALRRLLKLVQ